jgi:hypothetical protein
MRVWDLDPSKLCRRHLLGEHRELHAIYSVLSRGKTGYSRHPETLRWKGRLAALYIRHRLLVDEMSRRGYRHMSPLDRKFCRGSRIQTEFVDTIPEQKRILRSRGCGCRV